MFVTTSLCLFKADCLQFPDLKIWRREGERLMNQFLKRRLCLFFPLLQRWQFFFFFFFNVFLWHFSFPVPSPVCYPINWFLFYRVDSAVPFCCIFNFTVCTRFWLLASMLDSISPYFFFLMFLCITSRRSPVKRAWSMSFTQYRLIIDVRCTEWEQKMHLQQNSN